MTTPIAFHLPERVLLGGRYPEESNSKNNVCQGINVTKEKDNRAGDLGWVAAKAGLIGPLVDNVINKIYNKSDAEQEIRMSQQLPVVMSDHEIDLGYAQKDDEEAGKNAEIGGEVGHPPQKQVFGHPDDTRRGQDDKGNFLACPEESPVPELPEYKDPFQQGIGIGDTGVGNMSEIGKIDADYFSYEPGQE
jgi:hypothetical protein